MRRKLREGICGRGRHEAQIPGYAEACQPVHGFYENEEIRVFAMYQGT
jgi:hypothetical protein